VSIFTAPLGAKTACKLDVAQLKRIFGVVLLMLQPSCLMKAAGHLAIN
jgi:uncharacterized membrane protein YfcA